MIKKRILAVVVLAIGALVGFFVYTTTNGLGGGEVEKYDFKLGLDLSGGTHLVYRADVGNIDESQVKDAMDALRDVLERRINLFGVSETSVTIQESKLINDKEDRIIIDLPGVTDIDQAVSMIGQTPLLEFKIENPNFDAAAVSAALEGVEDPIIGQEIINKFPPQYLNTELTGRYLQKATLEFSSSGPQGGSGLGGEPVIALKFDKQGADLFEKITKENIGKPVAIYLDGSPISIPVVREAISGGEAVISGNSTPEEAKQLVGRLNSGALPVPIELISTQTIGPTLGLQAVNAGVKAAIIGFGILCVFLLFWYRLPGLIAIIALIIYAIMMFAIFKTIPVTLTAAGIAGFIISLGMAVDANILIFERMKEEMAEGRTISDAIENGFKRAWTSIRDGNTSSIITAIILFWFGTSLIQGFALTFGLGVFVSMISAVLVSKVLLKSITSKNGKVARFLFSNGFSK